MASLDEELGQEYLDQFDELDFSEGMEQRRMGVFLLENFYGTVISEIGERALLLDSLRSDSIKRQSSRIEGPLRRVLDDSEYPTFKKYQSITTEKVARDLRDEVYHDFQYDVDESKLEKYKGEGEKMREWLLEAAEKYRESHGPYTKAEFDETQERVDVLKSGENYDTIVRLLQKELHHATRTMLKADGTTGPFWNIEGTAFLHERIDHGQMTAFEDFQDLDEDEFETQEQYEQTIETGLELLEHIYKSQNPFEESQLRAEELEAAIKDEYDVVECNSKGGFVVVNESVTIDGEEIDDVHVNVYPVDDSVSIGNIHVRDRPDLSEDVREEIAEKSISRSADRENDGGAGTTIWVIRPTVVDSGLEELQEGCNRLLNGEI